MAVGPGLAGRLPVFPIIPTHLSYRFRLAVDFSAYARASFGRRSSISCGIKGEIFGEGDVVCLEIRAAYRKHQALFKFVAKLANVVAVFLSHQGDIRWSVVFSIATSLSDVDMRNWDLKGVWNANSVQ